MAIGRKAGDLKLNNPYKDIKQIRTDFRTNSSKNMVFKGGLILKENLSAPSK